jgi:hypothetical protein
METLQMSDMRGSGRGSTGIGGAGRKTAKGKWGGLGNSSNPLAVVQGTGAFTQPTRNCTGKK